MAVTWQPRTSARCLVVSINLIHCRIWADLSIGPQGRADRAGEKECSECKLMNGLGLIC